MSILQKPDILDTLIKEGIELHKRGAAYWALCPLHDEKNPSLKVDPERQNFYCFGCHEHGDVITYIQHYHNLTFKESLSYLGINGGINPKPDTRQIKKRQLVQKYRQWMSNYTDFLCNVLRMLDHRKRFIRTIKEIERLAYFYHQEALWTHHFDILLFGSEKEKLQLYAEIKYGR